MFDPVQDVDLLSGTIKLSYDSEEDLNYSAQYNGCDIAVVLNPIFDSVTSSKKIV